MPPGPLVEGGLRRPAPCSSLTALAYTRLSYRGAVRSEVEARAVAQRLGRRAPIGFGDPPRAEARLAPLFLAGGVLAALFIFLLRSL